MIECLARKNTVDPDRVRPKFPTNSSLQFKSLSERDGIELSIVSTEFGTSALPPQFYETS